MTEKNPSSSLSVVREGKQENSRAKEQHDIALAKLQELVLGYLGEASQNKPQETAIFRKWNGRWQTFVSIKNKQQKGVSILYGSAFKTHVDHMVALAKAQLEDMSKTEQPETVEHRGDGEAQ